MKILGIQKDHNASACLFYNNELIYFNQEERLSRIKKDSGIPYYCLKEISKICPEVDVVVFSGYDFVRHENSAILGLLKKIGFKLPRTVQWVCRQKGHHYLHAIKAFYNSGYDDALILVSDGRGSKYSLTNGSVAFETTSIFSASKSKGFNLLYKRLFTLGDVENAEVIWDNEFEVSKIKKPVWLDTNSIIDIRNDYDVGFMYEGTGRALGFDDEGGKLLGLQSYGQKNDSLPYTITVDDKFNMDIFLFDELNHNLGFNTKKYPELSHQNNQIDFSFHIQKTFEHIQLSRIKEFLDKTNSKNLVITGGCALNVVGNYHFKQHLPADINMFAEPMCGDEGNVIGAVYSYFREYMKLTPILPLKDLYICGSEPDYNFNLLEHEVIHDNVTAKDIVKLLIEKNLVAIFQGKAEGGPRALGNRSLLLDPRLPNGKEFVNRVKGRETFRPFACSIMLDKINDWFDLEGILESPFMMYAVNAKQGVSSKIPSVIHCDNTCRVQTVTLDQNKNFYNLIESFYEETGVPLLFNTSFNLADEPIVETLEDAFRSLRRSFIEYLYLPEINKLIYIKNAVANNT